MSNEKVFSPIIVWSEKAESSCENSVVKGVHEQVVELNAYRQKQKQQEQSNKSCMTCEGTISYLDLTVDSGSSEVENEVSNAIALIGHRIRVIKVSSGFGKLSKEWSSGEIRSLAA